MSFDCNQCNKQFVHKYELIMHRYCHSNINENNENNKMTCSLCSKKLSSRVHLKNHIKLHTRGKYLNCIKKIHEMVLKLLFQRQNLIVLSVRNHFLERTNWKFMREHTLQVF